MTRHLNSPLAEDLDAARAEGTAQVVELAGRRHRPVRGTHLPHAPGPSPMLDAASLALRGATALSEAHDTDDLDARASYVAEAEGLYIQALAAVRAIRRGGR